MIIRSKQLTLIDEPRIIGYGDSSFKVLEISRDTANRLVIKNHYSKKIYAGSYIHLGVYVQKDIMGVLQYGHAMNPASYQSVVEGTKQNEYLELNRMWLDNAMPRNSESRAISYSIKYIKNKYKGRIKWIQSFADERCGGLGIVYQACSFRYYGCHESIFWLLDNEVYHNSLMTRSPDLSRMAKYLQENKHRATSATYSQYRYIKFLKQNWVKRCKLKEQPYPKHYRKKSL